MYGQSNFVEELGGESKSTFKKGRRSNGGVTSD